MSFQTLRIKLPVLNNQSMQKVPEKIMLSSNSKTGCSINVSIIDTCQPTKLCMSYCYGTRGPIAFQKSLELQQANTIRFAYLANAPQSEVIKEAQGIIDALRQ
jgi:hypothetical protein